jgi:undecaprenyl pyrophosphate synthase
MVGMELTKDEVRKQIPVTKFSDEALRKRRKRSINFLMALIKSKITRIRSFPARFILNLSDNNVYHVIAGVLRANQ